MDVTDEQCSVGTPMRAHRMQTRKKQTNEHKRRGHQKKLAEELNERARERLSLSSQVEEQHESEESVIQNKLLLAPDRLSNPKLHELNMRPSIASRSALGTLECHLNGFRYTTHKGDKVDVLFSNIKHAFFQSCDNEHFALLHFRLKHSMLFGKKKSIDVQFFTEVGEIVTNLDKYHHQMDSDDVYLEQSEREQRRKMNQAFKIFCEQAERQANKTIEFDTPFRDLGFHGAYSRSNVLLQPTTNCLVSLVEWPPLVIALEDIELVHFERTTLHQRTFDMVWIYKDYTKKPDMIQQIPSKELDGIKEWLDSIDIHYTEGQQSLNWAKIMKTINEDINGFFEQGGWKFLEEDASDEEEGSDEDDEGNVYVPSESDSSEEESDDDDYTSESEESGTAELGDSEESGKDWSDLEEEARQEDRRKSFAEAHSSFRVKRPRQHSSSASPSPGKRMREE